jgi:hypothetical protein
MVPQESQSGMISIKNSKSMHFVILFLLVSFNISSFGCSPILVPLPPLFPERGSRFTLSAHIQPLPENHGSWSKEEVDTVKETIMTTVESHGFKKEGFFFVI